MPVDLTTLRRLVEAATPGPSTREILDRIEAVERERDRIKEHADAMAEQVFASCPGLVGCPCDLHGCPVARYRKEFPHAT